MFTCNLRSILVRTTRYPNHPATCTRPWRASLRIAWVLYQLGLLHNAKKSTSAMSSPTMKSTLLPIQSQQLQFLATLSRNSLAIINKSNQNQYQWVLFFTFNSFTTTSTMLTYYRIALFYLYDCCDCDYSSFSSS